MKKQLLFTLIGLMFLYLLNGCNGCKSYNLTTKEIDAIHKSNDSKRVIWYEIILPVKNEAKGYLFLRTDDQKYDTARINTSQAAAIIPLLQQPGVLYNTVSKSLIFIKEEINPNSVDVNKKDSIITKPL